MFKHLIAEFGFLADVFQHSQYKRVALELAAYVFEVKAVLLIVAVHTESRAGVQAEFFLGIVIYHLIKTYNSLFPRLDSTYNV